MISEVRKKANDIKFDTIISKLEKRGITAEKARTPEEAKEKALAFVKKGDKVACGGSMTLAETGLKDALEGMDIDLIDHAKAADPEAERIRGLTADVYFMSSNAVTMDGILMNIDGTGNRCAALCYGPKKVVLIIGANKICADEESAYRRIKTMACPENAVRLDRKTPCALKGVCAECVIPGQTICAMTVVTRLCNNGRLHVILVNEDLGY